jgi:hypothetical protein
MRILLLVVLTVFAAELDAQQAVPRTADGRPDLQGVWDFATVTPLQRPPQLAGKPFLSEQEAAEFVERTLREQNTDRPLPDGPVSIRTFSQLAYNDFWWERASSMAVVAGRIPSSLIVDPADGRLPAFTPAAEHRRRENQEMLESDLADDPEQRLLGEQCLSNHAGPPLMPARETSFVQIVQTKDFVVIAPEVANDARAIAIDGRPHLPAGIARWRGDARGRWDGDTLIVDTTNIRNNEVVAPGAARGGVFHLVERFTMTDVDTLVYEFTVDAPATYVAPWTAVMPMKRTTSRMFEYACHEGNYGLEDILRGARAQDR